MMLIVWPNLGSDHTKDGGVGWPISWRGLAGWLGAPAQLSEE